MKLNFFCWGLFLGKVRLQNLSNMKKKNGNIVKQTKGNKIEKENRGKYREKCASEKPQRKKKVEIVV